MTCEDLIFFFKICYCFQVVVPWCSPLSIRALFNLRPFLPDYAISQKDVSISLLFSSTVYFRQSGFDCRCGQREVTLASLNEIA